MVDESDNGSLSSQQKKQAKHSTSCSRARLLKGRWRCLLKRNDTSVHDLPKLVAACCVLHNICEVHGESFCEEWLDDVANDTSASSSTTLTSASVDSSV